MSKEKQRCCAITYQDHHDWQCSRNGSVERDGMWYCKQHDPIAVKERDAARQAKWDAERKAKKDAEKLAGSTRATELEVIELARKALLAAFAYESWEELKADLEHDRDVGSNQEDLALFDAIVKLDALKAEAGEGE